MCDLELDCVRKPSENKNLFSKNPENYFEFCKDFPQDYVSYLNVSEEVRITLFGFIAEHQNLRDFLRLPINFQTLGCVWVILACLKFTEG